MSMIRLLPSELLIEIFKYIEEDYKTLYSCILVNKQWHSINILTLWRNPFYSEKSTKILVNCLLVKDKNFLMENDIELKGFEFLGKQPLYNYARFTTKLDFNEISKNSQKIYARFTTELDFRKISKNLQKIIVSPNYYLEEMLLNFILDHSTVRSFKAIYSRDERLIYHHRFEDCFRNLYELDCNIYGSFKLLDELAITCRNIQVLKIDCNKDDFNLCYDNDVACSLAQLILAQNKIKQLVIKNSYNSPVSLPDVLKKAILIHSKSIINYESFGNNSLDYLVSKFQNLKSLSLFDNGRKSTQDKLKKIKNISLPNLETLNVEITRQLFLLCLSDFITLNGNGLKDLTIGATPKDRGYLRLIIKSIGQKCPNLEFLSICYRNHQEDKYLMEIFNNCFKLKHITFTNIFVYDYTLNGDKILAVLNQSLPKNLNTLIFKVKVDISKDESLDSLMKNWRGPRPFKILSVRGSIDLLKKYQDLGFLL